MTEEWQRRAAERIMHRVISVEIISAIIAEEHARHCPSAAAAPQYVPCNAQLCPVAGGGYLYCNAAKDHEGYHSHTFPFIAESALAPAAPKPTCNHDPHDLCDICCPEAQSTPPQEEGK